LADLARCIHIMPTSGHNFTAQAPLFPIFLLGVLATSDEIRDVSNNWFANVIQTPVRSSVPPLYQVLQRIWTWIDKEFEPRQSILLELTESIGTRTPWWERLVARTLEKENETLCLT